MNVSSYLIFLLTVSLVAFKPGPGALLHGNVALQQGRGAAIKMALGTETGHAAIFSLVYFTAHMYNKELGHTLYIISSFSGIYFLFLGLKSLLKLSRRSSTGIPWKAGFGFHLYFVGISWAFTNPVNLAFYTGILLPDLHLISSSYMQFCALLITLVIVFFLSHLLFILTPSAIFGSNLSDSRKKNFTVVNALVFVLLGGWFLVNSLTKLEIL